jgi:hypothetical protein
MKTPDKVNSLWLENTCAGISLREWEKYMKNTTKANGCTIKRLIKEHLPDLYKEIGLEWYNPYECNCVKKEGLLVYVHSAIEYFLKYN